MSTHGERMNRILVAANLSEERAALRSLLLSMDLQVVGETHDLQDTIALATSVQPSMVVVDWDLFRPPYITPLDALRAVCPASVSMVLLSRLNVRRHAELLSGADAFISKDESADSIVKRLRAAVMGESK